MRTAQQWMLPGGCAVFMLGGFQDLTGLSPEKPGLTP